MRPRNLNLRTSALAVLGAASAMSVVALAAEALVAEAKSAEHEREASPSEASQSLTDSRQLPKPVVSTHELMELFNQPLYRRLKQEMDKSPEARQHETLVHRGLQTAEVANLVAIRHEDAQWRRLAAELQQAGREFAAAAKQDDPAAISQAYRSLIGQCNACHQARGGDEAPQFDP